MAGKRIGKTYKNVTDGRYLMAMSTNVKAERICPIKQRKRIPENASVMRTKIQSTYPEAVEIENNVWELAHEMTYQTKRRRQQRRAYFMLMLSTNGDEHREYHVSPENFMPVGFGGTYVCSKNNLHKFYILGPCVNKRCRIRGCNGRLKMI